MNGTSRGGPLRTLRPYAGRIALAAAVGALAELAGLALMATSAWLICRAAQQPVISVLSVAIVAVRGFAVLRGSLRYAERLVGHDAVLRAQADLRGRVYDALVPVGAADRHSGQTLTSVVADVEAVQDVMLRCLLPAVVALLVAGAGTALCAILVPAVLLPLGLGLLLAIVAVPVATGAVTARAGLATAAARGELAVRTVDLVEGKEDLTVFAAMDGAVAAAQAAAARLARLERATVRHAGAAAACTLLIRGATVLAVLLLSVSAAHGHHLQVILVAVVVLTALLSFEPASALPDAAQRLVSGYAALRRVAAILAAEPAVLDPADPAPPPDWPVTLRVRGLSVRYGARAPLAVRDLDFDLRPGSRLVLIGPSGAGKSTVLSALMRLVEIDGGQIELNGVDLRHYAGDTVRRAVGGMPQDSHVFNTTIRTNLLLARPEATEEQLDDALRRARLLDWVRQLPDGLGTVAGPGGQELSGGQRRRLTLARAFLADPAVMVLDEPTEGLDPETADEIHRDVLRPGPHAVLLVTHHLTGLEGADEIVVLDQGGVMDRGTPADLLARPGYLRDLLAVSHL
jgi:ATP-binding cassette subfamily C protein CydC